MPPISSSRSAPESCWISPAASILAIQLLKSCVVNASSFAGHNLTVVAADRIADRCVAVRPQARRKLALDAVGEPGALKHHGRIDLNQRGACLDLGVGVRPGRDAATADERNTALRQAVNLRETGG